MDWAERQCFDAFFGWQFQAYFTCWVWSDVCYVTPVTTNSDYVHMNPNIPPVIVRSKCNHLKAVFL